MLIKHKFAAFVAKIPNSCTWTLYFFLAYISSYFLSGISAPLPDLDQSYQVVLEYARIHDFQFGRDIVFTFGPLGFLNAEVSQGLLLYNRILFALAWSGMVAWSTICLARQMSGPMKFVFLVWFLVYSHSGGLHAFLVIAYGCMILMGEVWENKATAAAFLITFALLALNKFTFFMAVTVSIILCVLVQIGKRNIKSSFVIMIFYGVVFIALWSFAGQHLENLLPWLRGSFEIADGYTDAMTIFPKVSVLTFSTVALLMFLAALLVVFQTARLNYSSIGILLVTITNVFLTWKNGFVRADAHTMGFILFLPLVFSVLLNEKLQKTMHRKPRLYVATFFMGVVLLCNWAADFQSPGIMLTKVIDWPSYMIGNSRLILHSFTGRWENCFESLRMSQQMKQVPDLPIARSIVGKAPVDVINYTQWAALANNLNYHPRPVIQGYSAYTPYLQDLNLSFYQSENRPQYVLFRMETIDERFPALDDAALLPYILRNYKPVAKDGDFLVLQASPKIASGTKLTLFHEQTVAFGEFFNLPVYNNDLLIMQVEVKSTFFGGLLKFLFQAPVLTMNTIMNGTKTSYRFIPAMAERGFVVSPLLLTNNDVTRYYNGSTGNRADSISFSKSGYDFGQTSDAVTIRLYKVDIL